MRIERITYSAYGRGSSEMAELRLCEEGDQTFLFMYRSSSSGGIARQRRRSTQTYRFKRKVVELQTEVIMPLFELANNLKLSRNVSLHAARDARNYWIQFQGGSERITYQWILHLPRQWQELEPIINFMSDWLDSTDWNDVPYFLNSE